MRHPRIETIVSMNPLNSFFWIFLVSTALYAEAPPQIDMSQFDKNTVEKLKERYHSPFEESKWTGGSWMGPGGYSMKNGIIIEPITFEEIEDCTGTCYGNAEMITGLLGANWDKDGEPQRDKNGKSAPPRIALAGARVSSKAETITGYSDFREFLQETPNRQAASSWARNSLHEQQTKDGAYQSTASSPQENKLYAEELQRRIDAGLLPNLTFNVPGTPVKHSVLLKEIKDNGDSYSFVTLDSNFPDATHEITMDKMTGDISSLGKYDGFKFGEGKTVKESLSKAVIGIGNPDGWKKIIEQHGSKTNPIPVRNEPNVGPGYKAPTEIKEHRL